MIIREVKPNKKFTYFVGVDISRNELDFAVMNGPALLFHIEIPNERGEIFLFIHELKSIHGVTIAKTLYCMENTGIYGFHLLSALGAFNAYVVVDRPLQIKHSLGFNRDKSDKVDAIRIAKYAYRFAQDLRLWKPKRIVIQKLAALMTLRSRMIKTRVIIELPLKEQQSFLEPYIDDLTRALCSRSVLNIRDDIDEIDRTIDLLIQKDENLRRLFDLIVSVPGLGRVTAIMIIIATNEFIDIDDAKKFACYAGVAPFARESGTMAGKARVSHIANKKVKSLLHIYALSAINSDPEIKDYYARKIKVQGKPKMSAINAVRNKLILRVFACVKQNRPYELKYTNPVLN